MNLRKIIVVLTYIRHDHYKKLIYNCFTATIINMQIIQLQYNIC